MEIIADTVTQKTEFHSFQAMVNTYLLATNSVGWTMSKIQGMSHLANVFPADFTSAASTGESQPPEANDAPQTIAGEQPALDTFQHKDSDISSFTIENGVRNDSHNTPIWGTAN